MGDPDTPWREPTASADGAQLSPGLVTDELAFAAGMHAALEDGKVLSAAKAREAASSWRRD